MSHVFRPAVTWSVLLLILALVAQLVSLPEAEAAKRKKRRPPARPTAPVVRVERLGLHITAVELNLWRQRASSGPYKSAGDVSRNSPGDWERIVKHAAAFQQAPTAGRWAGPVNNNRSGCVQRESDQARNEAFVPPYWEATEQRDAAFAAMVQQRPELARLAAKELLAQVRTPGVDFSDRRRYCLGSIDGDNNPGFNISNWLTRLLFTYDYVRVADPAALSAQERQEIDRWFAGAATWLQHGLDRKLDELFVNRNAGDYRLTRVGQGSWRRQLYAGGPEARTLHRRYNNRAAAVARYVALVGVAQGNASLIRSGKQFVTETLRFSYFPQGVLAEFERWKPDRPSQGWKYATHVAGSMLTIADALARSGDRGLYEYETTEGALGTEGRHHSGRARSLYTLVGDLLSYVDGSDRRSVPGAGPSDARGGIGVIDGRDGSHWIHDIGMAMGNQQWSDEAYRRIYLRTAPGTPAYPVKPARGQGHAEGGEWGIYPGMLLMFEQNGPPPQRAEEGNDKKKKSKSSKKNKRSRPKNRKGRR